VGAAEDQASPNPGHSIARECPTLADCTLGGCCRRGREASWGVFLAPAGPHSRAIGANICKALILRGAAIVRRRRAITLLHEGLGPLPSVVLKVSLGLDSCKVSSQKSNLVGTLEPPHDDNTFS
jgi:hypothetical protein